MPIGPGGQQYLLTISRVGAWAHQNLRVYWKFVFAPPSNLGDECVHTLFLESSKRKRERENAGGICLLSAFLFCNCRFVSSDRSSILSGPPPPPAPPPFFIVALLILLFFFFFFFPFFGRHFTLFHLPLTSRRCMFQCEFDGSPKKAILERIINNTVRAITL